MPDIRHQLQIAATPAAIFPLVTTARGFAQWWAADTRELTEPGRLVELAFFKRQTIYRLRPQTFVAPTTASWRCETGREWADTTLVFSVASQGAGSLLRFQHAGWAAETDYFVSCNTVWGALLFRLKAIAEGHPAGPLFGADGMAY